MKKTFILLLLLFLSTLTYASQVKEIIFFGDSLTDDGNLYRTIQVLPKSPPYFNGRFTNGPTWAEDLGKYYYNKSYVDYQNYAVGGATSIIHNPLNDSFVSPVTLTAEIYDYALRSVFTDKSETLFVIWIGANDYLYETDPDMDTITTDVVNNINWAINYLMGQGGKNFLILNLPDLSRTPYATQNNVVDRLHSVTMEHNQKLADLMKQLKNNNSNAKFTFVDIYTIFNDLMNNPAKYNQIYHQRLNNFTQACWQGEMMLKRNKENQIDTLNMDLKKGLKGSKIAQAKNFDTTSMSQMIVNSPSLDEAYNTSKLYESGIRPCDNGNQYIFWDHIHPTETVHQILAAIVEQRLGNI